MEQLNIISHTGEFMSYRANEDLLQTLMASAMILIISAAILCTLSTSLSVHELNSLSLREEQMQNISCLLDRLPFAMFNNNRIRLLSVLQQQLLQPIYNRWKSFQELLPHLQEMFYLKLEYHLPQPLLQHLRLSLKIASAILHASVKFWILWQASQLTNLNKLTTSSLDLSNVQKFSEHNLINEQQHASTNPNTSDLGSVFVEIQNTTQLGSGIQSEKSIHQHSKPGSSWKNNHNSKQSKFNIQWKMLMFTHQWTHSPFNTH